MAINLSDIKLQEPLQFTQAQGLQKTYAHYLLFRNDSPTLKAILNIVVPNQTELFTNIFTELNKKHVKEGLKQFAPNFLSAKIQTWEKNKYGITYEQYAEMRKYAEILNVFGAADKMAKEMYENQPQIDFIHEAVIQYFPKDTVEIVNNARKNLQISLEQGYIGKRSAYITEPNETDIPNNINSINIDKTNVFDKLPNVLHLEAVAELHRHAFLSADQKDVLEVIAHANKNEPNDVSGYIPNAKALYVKNTGDEYMVSSIQMNDDYKKYIKTMDGCWKKEEVKKAKQGGTKQKSKKARSTK